MSLPVSAESREDGSVPHFDIDASIVFQLGESLIRDPLQALLELIKNSYDAGAKEVTVIIETGGPPNDSPFDDARGFIEVLDTGIGMDRVDLIRGWLTISGSPKRRVKAERPDPDQLPLGRFPLGDKGLGRLGVQRLGENVEISTRPTRKGRVSDTEYSLAFSWDEFRRVERLSEVQVPIAELPARRKPGTSIRVSDLKDIKIWEQSKLLGSLQARLARLVSPFVPVPSFEIDLVLNGSPIDVLAVTQDVLRAAMIEYDLDYVGGMLHMAGRARMTFPRQEEDAPLYHELVERDGGAAFLSFLSTMREYRMYNVRATSELGWFLEFDLSKPLNEFDGVELRGRNVAEPGPFKGKVYYFDFKKVSGRLGTFKRPADFSAYVRQLSGIHVYRDGFGVRTAQDWLGLAEAFTSGSSWYGLRPSNTLGYIALSSRDNAALEETTDREGFKDTPEYRNFYALLRRFVTFSAGVQEFLRRGWNEFKSKHARVPDLAIKHSTPETRAAELNSRLVAAAPAMTRVKSVQAKISEELARVDQTYRDSLVALTTDAPNNGAVDRALQQLGEAHLGLKQSADEIQELLRQTEEFLGNIEQVRFYAEMLQNDIGKMRSQMAEVYEMLSLGLTAEALSHELGNVLNQLSQRTRDIRAYLKRQRSADTKVILFADYVHESIRALRKQLAHLAPSLRYVREQRTVFVVGDALAELVDYYRGVFQSREFPIAIELNVISDFSIRMNRGKLTQIVDNLVLNSEYWLTEEARLGRIQEALVSIEVEEPWIRIRDNGRGIDLELEDALFEPFVSGKAGGTGRGLGLFIVTQLLESEGCSITLNPERNPSGRRYVFQIDLSGALHDGR
jgi:signal transduction histidine kinase